MPYITYLPKHQPQLGRGVPDPDGVKSDGSRDCGPRTVQMGMDARTEGELVPSVTLIRERMGRQGYKTTSVRDAERAVDGWRSPGRRPVRYRVVESIEGVKSAVAMGRYVHACIDYGVFNRVVGRTGDPSFTGGHSVGILGQRLNDGEVQWRLFDPLDDKRRDGIPQGPRWVSRSAIVDAMTVFAGGPGKAWAGVFSGGQVR
jgi:hypothetical protein